MREEIIFPYQLESAFFTSLQFVRGPQLPDPTHLNFLAQLKVIDEEFPDKLQIHLKAETVPDQPMTISAELVGLFRLVDGQAQPDHTIVSEFVNERAIFQLWPLITQMVGLVTGQMGMEPFRMPTPYAFDFQPPQPASESEEEEC